MNKPTYLILTFLFVVLNITVVNGQAREENQTNTFVEKSLILSNAIGWKKDTALDKWVNNKNCISKRIVSGFIDTSQVYNFSSMYVLSFDHRYPKQTERFYVLVYENLYGWYKYPTIKEEWQFDRKTNVMILTQKEYKNIQNSLNAKSGKTLSVSSGWVNQFTGRSNILSEKEYQELLRDGIVKAFDSNGQTGKFMAISSQILDGKNIVRFLLPEYSYDLKERIRNEYFEVPLEDIIPLFTLK